MADLTITAANVAATQGAVTRHDCYAGATIAAGDVCYLDTAASNVAKLAQADGTALEATIKGIALNGAASGQPIALATTGSLNVGASLTVATVYILSANAGKICPAADLGSSSFLSVVGVATAADAMLLGIVNSGVEKA